MQVTFLDVRNAVMAALGAAFPDIPVRGEENQESASPSFYVRFLAPTHTQESGRRFRRVHPLAVHYYPAGAAANEEAYGVAEQLTSVLQQVTVAGQPVKGLGMYFEMPDGVLTFFVQYTVLVYAPAPDAPAMGTLDQQGGLQ
ncbi:MAG: hypothetical protein K0R57_4805 [Paenibacillaceae bacterium]|jgi:hypothetical protein|nr:hypothetical protein [Paenibacillaceae bacterium]